jgi:hypothetical protein
MNKGESAILKIKGIIIGQSYIDMKINIPLKWTERDPTELANEFLRRQFGKKFSRITEVTGGFIK